MTVDAPRERPTAEHASANPGPTVSVRLAGSPGLRSSSAAAEARRPRDASLALVGRLQRELGIRDPAYPLAGYGPTSALSEEDLLQGYGVRRRGEGR